MKNIGRLRIEREWLEKALLIREDLPREMFIYTCIGKALSAPQFKRVEGFSWPDVQALWKETRIVPLKKGRDGYIEFK